MTEEWFDNKPQKLTYEHNEFSVTVTANCPDITFGRVTDAVMGAISEPLMFSPELEPGAVIHYGPPRQKGWWRS